MYEIFRLHPPPWGSRLQVPHSGTAHGVPHMISTIFMFCVICSLDAIREARQTCILHLAYSRCHILPKNPRSFQSPFVVIILYNVNDKHAFTMIDNENSTMVL